MNILDLIPDSKPFKMKDLSGKIVRLEYREEELNKDILKVLIGRDMTTKDVYVIFYELGSVKEDC